MQMRVYGGNYGVLRHLPKFYIMFGELFPGFYYYISTIPEACSSQYDLSSLFVSRRNNSSCFCFMPSTYSVLENYLTKSNYGRSWKLCRVVFVGYKYELKG